MDRLGEFGHSAACRHDGGGYRQAMITTATKPGTCRLCGKPFNIGDLVEAWPGKPATAHADCSNKGIGQIEHGSAKTPLHSTPAISNPGELA
jgi:hypothetical protein